MEENSNEKKYKKVYIGKGTQVEKMDIVRVSIKVTDALNCLHKFEGEHYLTFEVARLQTPDQYGKTHTCYYSAVDEEQPKQS